MSKGQTIGDVPSNVLGMLSDLTAKLQHGSILPRELELFLKRQNPFVIANIHEEWQEFYRKYFRLATDFSDVSIPEDPGGFERVIFIPKNITYASAIKALRRKFKVYLDIDNPDRYVTGNVRISDQSYAIRLRDRQEADENWKNISANQLKEGGINSITLMERLIYELKYFDETGQHLDVENTTLCAGSCSSTGTVLGVRWDDNKLQVEWRFSDSTDIALRIREVVSA